MKLFSYIVTHDTGFSPNPFWGCCTLADCKPAIRRTAQVGDWVVGLSPKATGNRVVFAMKVDEILDYAWYFNEHLQNNGVSPGDLFLFFGLFRRIEILNGSYKWVGETRPYHVIWGWLQVGQVLHLDNSRPQGYEWAQYHPHFNRGADPNNVAYIACQHLKFDSMAESLPGAGTFSHFSISRQLTAAHAEKLSIWDLPGWFYPGRNRKPLTYHSDMQRWQRRGDRAVLKSVARGQEFILDCDEYPEAVQWAYDLIRRKNIEC